MHTHTCRPSVAGGYGGSPGCTSTRDTEHSRAQPLRVPRPAYTHKAGSLRPATRVCRLYLQPRKTIHADSCPHTRTCCATEGVIHFQPPTETHPAPVPEAGYTRPCSEQARPALPWNSQVLSQAWECPRPPPDRGCPSPRLWLWAPWISSFLGQPELPSAPVCPVPRGPEWSPCKGQGETRKGVACGRALLL